MELSDEITVLKNKIAELEKHNNNCPEVIYKEIFNISPIGLFYYDINGVITDCNKKFSEIVGAPKDSLIGMNTFTELENSEVISCIKESLIKGISYFEGEYTSVNGNKHIYAKGTFKGMRNDNDTIFSGLCVIEDITELNNTQNNMLIAKSNYETIFYNSPVPMVVHSKGKVVLINKATLKLAKIKDANKIVGQSILKFIHKDSLEKAIVNIQNTLNGKTSSMLEEKFVALDGKVFDVLVNSSVFNYNNEKSILAAFVDVTEFNLFKKQFNVITKGIESSHISVIITDSNSIIEYVNPRFTEISDFTLDEAKGKSIDIIKSTIHSKEFYDTLRNTLLLGETWKGELCSVKKDGTTFWEYAVISPILDESNNVVSFISIKEDITKQRKVENQLINRENHLSTIFDTAPDGIFEINKNGIIINCNAKFSKSIKLSKDKIINKHISDFTNDKEVFKLLFKQLIKSGYVESEVLQNNYDGTTTDVLRKVSAIYDSNNKFNGAIAFSSDISVMKENERMLINAKERAEESDNLKAAFLSNISHEIRTPLNAIVGFSSLITKQYIDPSVKQKYFQYIKQSNDSLLSIIDDIIDFSKIQSNQLEIFKDVFTINELLDELYSTFSKTLNTQNKTNVELKLHYKEKVFIRTDEHRLKQILSNLLSNAVKFTLNGSIEFGYEIINNKIIFTVSDTGIGISKKNLEVIFNQFTKFDATKKQKGTGIGLAIVSSLTKLLEGEINITSDLGIGTKIAVTLPCENIQEPNTYVSDDSSQHNKEVDWSDKTILIAEDDEFNFIVLEEFLIKTKVNIIRANNGEEAVLLYKKMANKINIILMDIQMPKLDGYETTKQILQINSNAKIIAQTAHTIKSDVKEKIKFTFSDNILKPISQDLLIKIIKKHI